MGVIYFLIYARKHESNLPTNICATAGKKTQWERKMQLLRWIQFPAWFNHSMVCFLDKSVYFLPMVFIMTFITTLCLNLWFLENSVVTKCIPCQGVVWFPLPNAKFLTLAFKWYTIEAPLSLRTSCKKSQGCCPQDPAGAYVPRTLWTRVLNKWPPRQVLVLLCVIPQKHNEFTPIF